jgi:predicted nucleic acid-binding protein
MVVLDTTILLLLIEPTAKAPIDPSTNKPVDKARQRIEYLLETLSQAKTKVFVPTPVLSELLVGAGNAKNQYLAEVQSSGALTIAPFDVKAAVELAFLLDGDGKRPKTTMSKQDTWAKLKFDRQIVAIAKANKVTDIYTDDTTLTAVAEANGIRAHRIWELPLPPQKAQQDLPLVSRDQDVEDDGE